jgi:pyruvate ferredoxin oxidoreductase delta subunit
MAEKTPKSRYEPTVREMLFSQVILDSGEDSISSTGDWRYQKPVIDVEKCNQCGLCWLYCPDCSVTPLEDGNYEVDLFYCKGCGICANVCPKNAITMIEEQV